MRYGTLTAAAGLVLLSFSASSAQSTTSGGTASMYFIHTSGAAGMVDLYLNGQMMANHVLAGTQNLFPMTFAPGVYTVVVTKVGVAPGTADLLSKSMDMSTDGGVYWVRFRPDNTRLGTYKFTTTSADPNQ